MRISKEEQEIIHEDTKESRIVAIISAMTFFVLLVISMAIMFSAGAVEITKKEIDGLPCYDKESNLIQGASCTETVYEGRKEQALLFFGGLIGIILSGILLVFNILSSDKLYYIMDYFG